MRINQLIFNNFFLNKKQNVQENKNTYQINTGMINPFAPRLKDTFEVSFTAKDHCSTQNFRIKEIPNLRCPVCGLIMLTEEQIAAYLKDVGSKKGEELVRALEKYEDESVMTNKPSLDKTGFGIYRPIKKDIIDIYKRLALENPEEDLYGLTKIEAARCIDELIAEQMDVIAELEEHIKANYSDEEQEALFKKVEEFVKQIKGESKDSCARKKFIFAMRKDLKSEKQKKEMDVITSKMPTSENDINSFFVKYSKAAKTPREIASKFVNQSKPTAEHIIPKALGGKDRLSNYICDCEDCNSKRGHMNFYDWLQDLPEFEERLQLYVDDVREAIDADFFKDSPEYDTYIEKIIETLAEVSEGEVILEVPEAKNPQKNEAVMQRREKEIVKIKAQNDKLARKRDELKKEIAQLREYPYFDDVDEHREILERLAEIDVELEQLNNKTIALRKPLYDLKRQVDDLEDALEAAKTSEQKVLAKKAYDAKKEIYDEKQAELNSIEKRVGRLKGKKIELKKRKKRFALREDAIRKKVEELRSLTGRITALNEKIEKLGNVSQKEADLSAAILATQATILQLEEANNVITSKEGFDVEDMSDLNEYNHQKELLKAANNLLTNKAYKKTNANAGLAREVIELAKKSIEKEIERLQELDTVQYFLNLASIKAEKERKANQESKFSEITTLRREVETHQEQIKILCNGRSQEEIQAEYKELLDEKRKIDEIHRLADKKKRLEHLIKIVRRNSVELDKLVNFRSMRNSEYSDIINAIDLDEIY